MAFIHVEQRGTRPSYKAPGCCATDPRWRPRPGSLTCAATWAMQAAPAALATDDLPGTPWSQPVRGAAQWRSPSPPERGTPLSPEQLRSFTSDGYLVLEINELSPAFHAELYAKATAMMDGSNPPAAGLDPPCAGSGHRGMQEIEELETVLSSPTYHGALESILGTDYVQHPCRFMHSGGNQGWYSFW